MATIRNCKKDLLLIHFDKTVLPILNIRTLSGYVEKYLNVISTIIYFYETNLKDNRKCETVVKCYYCFKVERGFLSIVVSVIVAVRLIYVRFPSIVVSVIVVVRLIEVLQD